MSTLDPGVTGKRFLATEQAERTKRKGAKRVKPRKLSKRPKKAGADKQTPKVLNTPPGSPFKTIPQAGKDYFGMSKNGSYDAAERGDFGKLVMIGRRKFVVVPVIEAMIKAAAEAAE